MQIRKTFSIFGYNDNFNTPVIDYRRKKTWEFVLCITDRGDHVLLLCARHTFNRRLSKQSRVDEVC